MSNHSYAYAMGRIRAAERKLLVQSQFDRMVESKTAEDAFRILHEAEYGSGGAGGGADLGAQLGALEYERLLDAENAKLVAFVHSVSPDPRLVNIFLLRYDYLNLKALLKAEFLNAKAEPPLSGDGVIPPEKLSAFVRDRAFSDLHPAMAAGILGAIRAFEQSLAAQNPDPQSIDIKLDLAMYGHMLAESDGLGNPFVDRLIRMEIDFANIGAFIRMREMRKGPGFLRDSLIPGGRLEPGVFTKHYQDSAEGFLGAIRHTPYSQICEDGIKNFQATGLMTVFERGADNYVCRYIQSVKLFPVGPEIIVAYYMARRLEMKNVGIVMVGKINSISADSIRERLRECYA